MTTSGGLRPLVCARPGCPHRYDEHAPGGGNCMVWDRDNGLDCGCVGFQWVPLEGAVNRARPPRSAS